MIKQLPKLERLLLDTDINIELEPLLAAVGFRPTFAFKVGANVRRDRDLVRWARKHKQILLCHDKYRDKQTRLEVYQEVYHRGGKIIHIGGGPEQDIYTSLGKILLYRESWLEWFKVHEGIITVHNQGMKKQDAHRLFTFVQREMDLEVDPEKTIKSRKIIRGKNRRQLKQTPVDQTRLNI